MFDAMRISIKTCVLDILENKLFFRLRLRCDGMPQCSDVMTYLIYVAIYSDYLRIRDISSHFLLSGFVHLLMIY